MRFSCVSHKLTGLVAPYYHITFGPQYTVHSTQTYGMERNGFLLIQLIFFVGDYCRDRKKIKKPTNGSDEMILFSDVNEFTNEMRSISSNALGYAPQLHLLSNRLWLWRMAHIHIQMDTRHNIYGRRKNALSLKSFIVLFSSLDSLFVNSLPFSVSANGTRRERQKFFWFTAIRHTQNNCAFLFSSKK